MRPTRWPPTTRRDWRGSWFTQQASYTYQDDYLYGGGDNEVNNDNARPLVTGSNGASLTLDWNLGALNLTSISAYKDYHFQAVNDEGTVFDVYRNAGGFWNDYKQWSQELRVSGTLGELADYQTGLYYMKVHNVADYRRAWGNDAGAWFATTAQYNRLDRAVNPDGSVSGGRALLQNSLDRLLMSFNSPAGVQDIQNESVAAFGQLNWHIADAVHGDHGRAVHERGPADDFAHRPQGQRQRAGAQSGCGQQRLARGLLFERDHRSACWPATLLRSSHSPTRWRSNTSASLRLARRWRVQQPHRAAAPAGGRCEGHPPLADRRGVPDELRRKAYKDTQPAFVVSPSWKINEQLSTYVSWQHGEKAGISQFVNGVSNVVRAEKTDAYEIGLKTVLLNDTLVFNTAVFYSDIEDYQQQVRIVDEYTTNLNIANGVAPSIAYTSATGNVPLVTVKGVEIDGVYAGIPNTQLRFSGAYNDAYYADFPNLAQPVENGYPGRAAVSRCQSARNIAGLVQVLVQSRRGLPRAGMRLRSSSTPARTPRSRASSTATSHCRAMRGFRRARSSTWRWVSARAAAASM